MKTYKGDKFSSCLTAALQMLISIPKVMWMFLHHHYRSGNPHTTEISEEISRYIKGESNVKDILFIMRAYSVDGPLSSAHLPSTLIFFRVLHEYVSSEIKYADDHVRELWGKFTEGTFNFLELRGEKGKKLKNILETQISGELPEYLVIRIYHPPSGGPDQEIQLSNGKIYQLNCIVDKDSSTGRYYSSVVKNNCWRLKDERSSASKNEVQTRSNYIYLYIRAWPYHCQVDGCPSEEKFDKAELDLHHQTEHPTCSFCKQKFLLGCLYREHLDGCRKAADRKRYCSADSGNGSIAEVTQEEDPPLLPTPSEKGGNKKRKLSVDNTPESSTKKVKCGSVDLFPKIKEVGKELRTTGKIIQNKSASASQSVYKSFNYSYLADHQIVFFYKSDGDHFTIHSYCPNSSNMKYEICLKSENLSPVQIEGVIGDKKRILFSRLNTPVIYYDLIVKTGS